METKSSSSDHLAKLKNLLEFLISNLSLLQQQVEQIRKLLQQAEELFRGSLELKNLPELRDFDSLLIYFKNGLEQIDTYLEKTASEPFKTRLQEIYEFLAQKITVSPRTNKILLIEDDPLTARLITHYLKDLKVEITTFTEAEAGLDYLKSDLPDLILLDLILPGMDGFQFLNEVKKDQHIQKIPVIIMSSISGEKEILKALELGAADYITKPFSPRIVNAKIKHYLNFQ
ncbi:MAG: response regulator [Candidatus Aminicenantes bacterium]|nr:response regulator [Candidatus Aminicenantes bacterium]